ncbi:LamG domain-containing protein [Carboxylicivirga marina]|uniref:LamG domain-containing protein n=1 Tax=Carboxylicivirga marina TaxID=2800988 RepID=A0ABS1HKT3_9BACT|nr:LamG domain-containing protein [Carboxylicivirga marina]MBK3518282.1 LamG domain-containing protein [Carboxylicivirga marina]
MKKTSLNLLLLLFVGIVVYTSCSENVLPEEIVGTPGVNVIENEVAVPGPNSIGIQYTLSATDDVDYIECVSSIGNHNIEPTASGKLYEGLDALTEYTFYLSTVYDNGDKSKAIKVRATPERFIENEVQNLTAVPGPGSIEIQYTLSTTEGVDYIECVSSIGTDMITPTETGKLYEGLDSSTEYTFKLSTVYLNGDKSSQTVNVSASPIKDASIAQPVLHYTFNDVLTNSGTANAIGDLNVLTGGVATYVDGKADKGYKVISSPNNVLWSEYNEISGQDARTITMWVKINAKPTINQYLFNFGQDHGIKGQRYSFAVGKTSGSPRVEIAGDGYEASGALAVTPGEWVFVAVTHTDGAGTMAGSTLYRGDGNSLISEAAKAANGQALNTQYNLITDTKYALVGAKYAGTNPSGITDCQIDDVRVYDVALSQAELEAVMQSAIVN